MSVPGRKVHGRREGETRGGLRGVYMGRAKSLLLQKREKKKKKKKKKKMQGLEKDVRNAGRLG